MRESMVRECKMCYCRFKYQHWYSLRLRLTTSASQLYHTPKAGGGTDKEGKETKTDGVDVKEEAAQDDDTRVSVQ